MHPTVANLVLAEEIDSALLKYHRDVATAEGTSHTLKIVNARFSVSELPSASVMGRCPRQRWLSDHKVPVTNPPKERSLHVLFSQGKVVGQMVYEAIAANSYFHNVEAEQYGMHVDNSGEPLYTYTVDVVGTFKTYHHFLVEAKFTSSLELKPHYAMQAVAYHYATKRVPFVVVVTRFDWAVYHLYLENNRWFAARYNPGTKDWSREHAFMMFDEDFHNEVQKQKAYAALKQDVPVVDNPVWMKSISEGKVQMQFGAEDCGKVTRQPKVMKANSRKEGGPKAGEEVRGNLEITCPYFAHCYGNSYVGSTDVPIKMIGTNPVLDDGEEIF